jgi:hypothetical protein
MNHHENLKPEIQYVYYFLETMMWIYLFSLFSPKTWHLEDVKWRKASTDLSAIWMNAIIQRS